MQIRGRLAGRSARALLLMPVLSMLPMSGAMATELEVFHADSLAGPMRELKNAFQAKHAGVTLNLTSGVSRQLAERNLKGDACDVFAPASPAVIDEDLINKPAGGSGKDASSWYVVFSANEMEIITAKGNPLGISPVGDLLKPGVKYVRVTGEKDRATGRTIEFLNRAASLEGKPDLARKLVDATRVEPGKATTVPNTVNAVKQGRADAGIVYYSSAVAVRSDVDIVGFPATVNMSEAIRNAATVPGTTRHVPDAIAFVRFLLSAEAQDILKESGQPPVEPAMRKGVLPADLP